MNVSIWILPVKTTQVTPDGPLSARAQIVEWRGMRSSPQGATERGPLRHHFPAHGPIPTHRFPALAKASAAAHVTDAEVGVRGTTETTWGAGRRGIRGQEAGAFASE